MIKRNSVKKNFFLDISLNIISSALSAVILQFVIYPLISRKLDQISFGEILTIMGIVNISAVMLGNSLNNIRLIVNSEYEEEKVTGDFLPLLGMASIVNISIIIVATFLLNISKSPFSIFILVIISLLTLMRSYLSVAYRIKINYKMIFYHSVVYCIGLIIGAILMQFWFSWEIAFLCGEIFSFIYLIFTSDLHKEPIKITLKFRSTLKRYYYLAISSFIGNVLVYLDRLIILPVLGGRSVAVYYAATIIGKMSSFVLQPISGVLLTYFSKSKRRMRVKEFWIINLLVLGFSLIALLGCVILTSYILKFLYPNLYDDAVKILYLANLAAILTAASSITQSIILKYCATIWQTIIQTIYGAIYIGLGLVLINHSGLIGFCIAAIIAVLVKILLFLTIGAVSLRK
ncbi:lipopolysaccharide biosynthesis protein [Peribacillus frigoritolerans]|uniref:lipopolysaccharide biosynthesis protein n=1 Tax=Peribacillus frigoritolerans TaxID=450367 RepID=UPI0011A33E56|nr:hypothetical protein [Peribacillus frigoritolerans]